MSRNRAEKYFAKKSGFLLLQLTAGSVLFFWVFSFAQSEYIYNAKGKRDPLIPLLTPQGVLLKLDNDEETVTGKLKIEGIIYDKNGNSYAIVEGKVVRVGDFTDQGYRVLKIEDNKVVFMKDGEPLEIYLKEDMNVK